jgi:hypothetical protein
LRWRTENTLKNGFSSRLEGNENEKMVSRAFHYLDFYV